MFMEELKCDVPVYKVHIEHGDGVFPSTFQDHEDVMWISPGRMPQESLVSLRQSRKKVLMGLKLTQFGRPSSGIMKTSMKVSIYLG